MVSVYLIIEVRSYREALERTLEASGQDVVGVADHPLAAIWEIEVIQPDVTLMGASGPDAPRWVREIREAAPDTSVLAIGVGEAEREILAWAEAGVGGYLGRDASLLELTGAIEAIARGEAPCHPRTAAILLRRLASGSDPAPPTLQCGSHLTRREREIVRLLGEGLSNQQIARRCHIALPTVKNHVHNVLEKLGVHDRAEAVRTVRRIGFLGAAESETVSRPHLHPAGSVVHMASYRP